MDTSLNTLQIGSSGGGGLWSLGTSIGPVTAGFAFNNGAGVNGALFNPAALGLSQLPGGGNTPYFTTATLVANFNAAPVLQPGTFSPFVRMQNVGSGGGGSLALTGSVPVPSTLPMLGISFLGLAFWHLRQRTSIL